MNNEAVDKQLATRADPRVQLAFERTFLAYERTRVAWVRTALALISFGFAIAKVLQYLREKQGETATLMSPRAVGLVMIVIGWSA
jgi:inner membrane protein YidH